ncbi:endonuclease VIII [Bacillus lacus]|uniref:Endonuclease VIII n=1 Tax=Metabacillus lacus TaxID=1983721 RepID=A0A7X2LVT9_9BACI|nr:DNA-formamidopyrimidine glycosylase family protein [Metabacillus lacus]MRX70760.1 endonuclease VIII [Metabacillus lacus]
MPELPEMENYRILLEQRLAGQQILSANINREKSLNTAAHTFLEQVVNQRIVVIERKAKHLLFHLDNNQFLLLHLMLGGWLYFGNDEDKPERTIQIEISFGHFSLYFIGLRLGYLHLHSINSASEVLRKLGPEPLNPSFTESIFLKSIHGSKSQLKTKLVNQEFISGIGNCYSDEICFHARLKPSRRLNELTVEEAKQLYTSIKYVLKDALNHGGYMEHPLYKGDQLTGGYDSICKVYDREGEPCFRCNTTITKEILSSKKTFYCSFCQK